MANVDGLYYEVHGPESAKPVVMSAGLGGSGAYWAPNLEALAKHHRVVLYDQRGTGRSDRDLPPELTIEQMADDVLSILDDLEVGQTHFVGHALGAAIGLTLALRTPERLNRLVLVNGWANLEPHTARCFEIRLRILRDSGTRAYIQAQPLFLYPANWIALNEQTIERETAHQVASFQGEANLEARIAALAAFDVQSRLGEVRAPILAYSTEDDMLVPSIASSRIFDRLPDVSGSIAAHRRWGGHACNVTDPDDFNDTVPAWLAGEYLPHRS